jgi:Secretion system C-terminal sorting domain
MSKTITLIFLCLFCTTALFSQIDPFSDFKKKVTVEKSINIYTLGIGVDDSIEVATNFDAACNPLKTIKSKWTYQEKKLFYQDKDSFSYVMVGTILRPASKTHSIWRFDKQEWENQTSYTFNYQNNNPFFVERITSNFNAGIKKWVKIAVEVFQLDRKGNTLIYENYDPFSTPQNLKHKIAYEYTTWGALTYLKVERPSNGDWRTDSLKTIEYDGKRNRINATLTTYMYDKLDNQLSENTQKDSVLLKYSGGFLTYRKTEGKYPSIDSFIYDGQKVLILAISFNANLLGSIDTSQVNMTYYENINGKSLLQKKVFKRFIKWHNQSTNKDTAYWIISYTDFYTHNNLNQVTSIKSISSDPQYNYAVSYSKVLFNYCAGTSAPSKEMHENLAYSISPNPVNQTLFIRFDEPNSFNHSIQIMDVLGNTLKWINKENGDLRQIDVSDFAAGIYFLKVEMGNKVGVKKFVVNR